MNPPRVLLVTGPGGVGKTTIAAATAVRCADVARAASTGARTLLLTTESDATLGDALDVVVTPTPTAVAEGLWAARAGSADSDGTHGTDLGDLVRAGGWRTVVVDGRPDELVDEPGTSISLVVTAESRVLATAKRLAIDLALAGRAPDVVVVNRLLPESVAGEWLLSRLATERRHLAEVEAGFQPGPVHRVDLADDDAVGVEALRRLAIACYGEEDPAPSDAHVRTLRITRSDGGYDLALPLPFVQRGDVDLARQGDELVISVGDRTRRLELPDSLRRRTIASARFADGQLLVHFADPR